MFRNPLKLNRRFATVSFSVIVFSAFFIVGVFSKFYKIAEENILQKWQNITVQSAAQVNFYLKTPLDAVNFSSVTLNHMLANGTSHEEALNYLLNETKAYSLIINENNTGIYSYYNGKYLDGSGWIPPDDYESKTRPWYTAALSGKGKPVVSQPFLNLQTNTMMMSVCQLLNDGESVVSMDVFLDSVQNMMEKLARQPEVAVASVINKESYVLADSNPEHVGKNMMELNAQNKFENEHTLFTEEINDDWNLLLVLENHILFKSLKHIYILASGILLFVIVLVFISVLYMNHKYEEARALGNEVKAVANIYVAVAKVSLKTGSIECIRTNEDFDALLEGDFTNFSDRSTHFANIISSEQSRDILKRFMDMSSLEERLKKTSSISQEILDSKGRWLRIRFITVDFSPDNSIHHILWALESIDEDRKQQEKLRKLSETDLMTGITNRGTGELRIRQAISEGKKGMFCLMDADKFKSINDTLGHKVGDEVICAIAECMKNTFRDADIYFRLGGDEYAVFSTGVTTQEIGERIMARFFEQVNKISIPALGERKISISVGISFYPKTNLEGRDGFETLYMRADEGLYKSKKIEGNAFTFVM
ncbi:MAG: diguanylate cyclase [Treponema sp.]|nr:diguanylate cyclase [Treponema sp.]